MKHIYMLTNKNTDRQGSSSSEFISSTRKLTYMELQTLRDCLSAAKTEAKNNVFELNDHDIIQDAIYRFYGTTGRNLNFADDSIICEITF